MNEGLIPRRYAKALLKVAQERGDDKRLYSLMGTLAASFEAHPDLSTAVANPFISADEKIKLLTTAAGAGDKDVTYADFLKLLRNNNRMPLVRGIALAYGEDYRRSNNIYKVEVTAAAPMDSAEESRLKKLVQSHLKGGTMEYTFKVDPDLIGGFTVSIGSEKLDSSVRNSLNELRLKLLG